MRIGIDCRLWNESGVGRYIRNLVGTLRKIDLENFYTLFVTPEDVENVRYYVSSEKWNAVTSDVRWHTIQEQFEFPKVLNKERLDLVHFPYFSVPVFYNKPFVVTIHDLIINHYPTGKATTLPLPVYQLKLLGYRFALQQAAKKAKAIITVSHATEKEIIDHLHVPKEKVFVTYEGVDEKLESENRNYESRITGDYFLYVGNAYPHKNLERLTEAFSQVVSNENRSDSNGLDEPSSNSGLKLMLVGKEDYFYRQLKQKVKRKGLEHSIVFLGHVSDEELRSLYRHAVALVMPSLMEGFGLQVVEAMAQHCLVVASNIPALVEVSKGNAVLFDPIDPSDIAQTLLRVYKNRGAYEELRWNGKSAVKDYSWETMVKQTLAIYKKAV